MKTRKGVLKRTKKTSNPKRTKSVQEPFVDYVDPKVVETSDLVPNK